MNEYSAKHIKLITMIAGIIGAVICLVMAFADAEGILAKIMWCLLGLVFLVLIYPISKIGDLLERSVKQEHELKRLSSRQAKLSSGVSQYSPFNKTPSAPSTASQRTVTSAAISIPAKDRATGQTTTVPAQKTKILDPETGEFGYKQQAAKRRSVGAETVEINKSFRVTTRFVPLSSQRSISAGGLHTVAVRRNGCVIAIGDNTYGQCDTYNWRDITSVCAGNHHTLGLKSDGTVHACGYNGHGQCNVQNWTGVSAIAAGACHSVGLLANGACIAIGDNTYGQCNVYDWREVVYIAAGENYTVGIRHDGCNIGLRAGSSHPLHQLVEVFIQLLLGQAVIALVILRVFHRDGDAAVGKGDISRVRHIHEQVDIGTGGDQDDGGIAVGHALDAICTAHSAPPYRPVEPKPPPPRTVSLSFSASTKPGVNTGVTTTWAIRSPWVTVWGSAP